MPLARTQYEADGSTKTFSIPFDYINKSDVVVSVDGSETTDFTWTSGSTIKFSTAPTNGTVIDVLRETERKSQLVDFQDASTLLESDLDLMAQQTFFLAQEAFDQAGATLYLKPDGSYSASTRRIGDLGDPIGPEDATNKQYVDGQLAEAESATDARIAAEHWAEHPEDETVPEGDGSEYSAHHWANKASQDADSIATDAAQASQDADTASTAATAAEDAQSAAESAQSGVAADASAASDSASAAATSESNASTYETQAESHRDQAKGYKNTASTQASDASDSANDAFTYKNKAEEWASKQEGVTVEAGEYSAKHYANKAGASASNAASSESAASDSETAASNSADAAAASASSIGDAETNVVGYAEEAKHWANYPVDSEVPEGSVDEFSARHWADKAKGYAEDTEAAATGVHDSIREGKKESAPSEDAVFQEFAGLGTAAKSDDADFATSAQGDTADSALQPADVGTAAAEDTTAFASAAQGDKADSALQDASQFATAAQGDKADSALQSSDVGTAAAKDATDFASASQGDTADSALQPSNISTGTGNSSVNVMSQKAVTDEFDALGTAAQSDNADFATAAQGAKADSALQDASQFATAAQGSKADSALQSSDVKVTTGSSNTYPMSQGAVTNALSDKLDTTGTASDSDKLGGTSASEYVKKGEGGGFKGEMVVLGTPGSGSFTVPSGVTQVKVTVVGGGSAAAGSNGAEGGNSGIFGVVANGCPVSRNEKEYGPVGNNPGGKVKLLLAGGQGVTDTKHDKTIGGSSYLQPGNSEHGLYGSGGGSSDSTQDPSGGGGCSIFTEEVSGGQSVSYTVGAGGNPSHYYSGAKGGGDGVIIIEY